MSDHEAEELRKAARDAEVAEHQAAIYKKYNDPLADECRENANAAGARVGELLRRQRESADSPTSIVEKWRW